MNDECVARTHATGHAAVPVGPPEEGSVPVRALRMSGGHGPTLAVHSVAVGLHVRCEIHYGLPWLRSYDAMLWKGHGYQRSVGLYARCEIDYGSPCYDAMLGKEHDYQRSVGFYARCEIHCGFPCYDVMLGKEHGYQKLVGGPVDCAVKPKKAYGYAMKLWWEPRYGLLRRGALGSEEHS